MPASSRVRRCVEAAAFVAVWMALGFALHLSVNAYLLTGIPLTVLFQLLVRQRPLVALWVRDATVFRMDRLSFLFAGALAIVPAIVMRAHLRQRHKLSWVVLACDALACLSSLPAGFAFRRFRVDTWKSLARCCGIVAAIAVPVSLLGYLATPHHAPFHAVPFGKTVAASFLWYLPYVFLVEECSFRGLLDAHVHHPGEAHRVWSALFVSSLWGVWHYPVAGHGHLSAIPFLAIFQCLTGVPLSIYWRRSGNVGVPDAAHSMVDAVRNGCMASLTMAGPR